MRLSLGSWLRVLGGLALSLICVSGIVRAVTRNTGEPASIVIAVLTVIVCLFFLVIGVSMALLGFGYRGRKRPRRKSS